MPAVTPAAISCWRPSTSVNIDCAESSTAAHASRSLDDLACPNARVWLSTSWVETRKTGGGPDGDEDREPTQRLELERIRERAAICAAVAREGGQETVRGRRRCRVGGRACRGLGPRGAGHGLHGAPEVLREPTD